MTNISNSPLDAILAQLENVRGGDGKWTARCPAHDDRAPSLSITTGDDGRVLLKCFAGCAAKDIVASLGMKMADLFSPSSHRRHNGKSSKSTKETNSAKPNNNKPSGPKTYPSWKAAMSALDYHLGTRTATWPYRDASGKLVAMVGRWDPASGKTYRPSSLHGDAWRIGDPPGKWPIYRQPEILKATGVPTWICEGEKCADIAAAIGLAATASAHGAQSPHKTDWTPLAGRDAIIIPDADAAGENYAAAVARILMTLTPPARVKVLRLPGLGDGEDIADYKARRDESGESPDISTTDEIMALAARVDWETTPAPAPATTTPIDADDADDGPCPPNEASDDPHRLGRLYLEIHCTHADGQTLFRHRDEWHRWDGAAHRVLPDAELRSHLTNAIKTEMDRVNLEEMDSGKMTDDGPPKVRKVTGRLTSDVLHALASMTTLSGRIDAPAWIGDNGPFPADELLACQNGLVHLPSFVNNKPHFTPPTPRFFSPNCLDFNFAPSGPSPSAWLDFLSRLWPDDTQSIEALQEWFGYCLTPDTSQQKILLAVGPKRSGKGTIARVLVAMIGRHNVAGPTLSSLGTNFGMWPLVGKSVAIISDARLSGRTDTAVVIERLLSISGEDTITVDRKNLPPITVKLPTRFMILTNELPRLADAGGALTGRMILLRMTNSWHGKEDTALTNRLLVELPSILLWAIEGWKRLRERGRIIEPEASAEMIRELDDLGSPVGAFVRDCCRISPVGEIDRAVLFDCWRQWCTDQGRDHPGDAATFGRNLRAVVPALGDVQRRTDMGMRRFYTAISTK